MTNNFGEIERKLLNNKEVDRNPASQCLTSPLHGCVVERMVEELQGYSSLPFFFVTRSDSDSTNKQRINPPYIWNIRAKKQYLYVRK